MSSTTKKIFGTDGIRGAANEGYLTPGFLLKLGQVLGTFIRQKPRAFETHQLDRVARFHKIPGRKKQARKDTVIIGRDPRLSGPMITRAISSGLLATGLDIVDVGVISTPGLAYLTRYNHCHRLGIMISASHNPVGDNGVKLLSPEGLKIPDATELKIEKQLTRPDFQPVCARCTQVGSVIPGHHEIKTYVNEVIKNVTGRKFSLKGFKVVLDCANGATSEIAPEVFRRLGARVITIHHRPDGQNINHRCGSLYPAVVARAVRKHKAQIGFSFDGDGDRVIAVDEKGQVRDGDHIMAVAARFLKKHRALPKNTVVATTMSNIGLARSLREAGIKLLRTPVGDRYVIEKMLAGHYLLGGEQSGHIIFMDQSTTGDGLITALEIVKIMKKGNEKFSVLADCLKVFPQVLFNVRVKHKRPFDQIKAIKQKARAIEKELGDSGRLLLRYSGTEPLARIMLEGRDKKQITSLANDLARIIKKQLG